MDLKFTMPGRPGRKPTGEPTSADDIRLQVRFKPADWPQVEELLRRSGHATTPDLIRAALAHYAKEFPDPKPRRK